jgi:UMF1 family MFS transporter
MKIKRETLAWAFYDWANSAFATSIMAGFFPIFFKQYWCSGVEVSTSTFRLGLANSIGSLVVIFLAPILGAMADQAGAKKKFLFFFAMLGAVMSAGLYTVAQGAWLIASLFYIFGIIGFSGGNVFYDSLLVNVASPAASDRVSALGFAMGYLGGGLLFAVNVAMTLKPGLFGLADTPQAVRLSFLSVGIWWAVFSLPIMLWVKESAPTAASHRQGMMAAGFRQLFTTFKEIRKLRVVFIFLAGYWLYIDALDTIIRMAVDYGLSLGFASSGLIVALLITQFVGFPAALVFGRLGEKMGTKKAILLGIGIYLLVTVWAMSMETIKEFYLLAVAIGLVQGGVQSLSRSLYSRLIPAGKSGEFFGFYNMLGKFAAVLGPLLMGLVAMFTRSPRLSLLAIIVLFVSGAVLLCLVNEEEGARLARQMK